MMATLKRAAAGIFVAAAALMLVGGVLHAIEHQTHGQPCLACAVVPLTSPTFDGISMGLDLRYVGPVASSPLFPAGTQLATDHASRAPPRAV
jgi:hypothetical protein